MHTPVESQSVPAAREHLTEARAALFRAAWATGEGAPLALLQAAEHADAAIRVLEAYGRDVRRPPPEDWTRH